jgi:hypothetical protein
MLNRINFVVFEQRDGSTSVTRILYTARIPHWVVQATRDARTSDLKIACAFQNTNSCGYEQAEIRRLITDKRRKRSKFVERLVRLDQESYERFASVGARGEHVGK